MSLGDKQLRYGAIPYRAQWFDNGNGAYTFSNNFDSVAGKTTGDLAGIATNSAIGQVPIRFARPYKGDIIEARLTFQATAPSSFGAIFMMYGCDFAADGFTPDIASVSAARKASDWKKIYGDPAARVFGNQANIFFNGFNLMPLIPKRGDANFNEDGFIIVFDITSKSDPTDPSLGWFLYNFKIDCIVQMAEL